ncbi:MAG: isoprenylcysteine carboxylmethyltransferase family protein [Ruminococcus flavefaciens]|nr:isoprenylcysteine carboxylmethyltransferase family protein [Ruminococcus flavefaciens]
MKNKEHLPVYGVGPLIVIPQILFTTVGIIMSVYGLFESGKINILKIPFLIIGIILIVYGAYMWYSANYKAKVFDGIVENRLITSGIYSVVRNPLYSAFLLICTGAVFIAGNVFLFVIPVICWIYMSVLLKHTEEKWLTDLYGQEYLDYCKNVNRCIPFFPKKR